MKTHCPTDLLSPGGDRRDDFLCRPSEDSVLRLSGHGLGRLSDDPRRLSDDPRRLSDDPRRLSDDDLIRRTGDLTRRSRHTEALLLAHLGEIDGRRLYLREACSSMFAFCTERLHFSEGEAWLRIAAARAAREYPVILEMLADGRLHLSAVARLAPHLTAENRDAVLGRAVHRSKREVLELVAELSPRADVPSLVRRLPPRMDGGRLASVCLSPTAAALSPTRVTLSSTVAAALSPTAAREVLGLCPDTADRFESPVSPQSPGRSGGSPTAIPCRTASSPEPAPSSRLPAPRHTPTLEPLAPGRYRVQFTAGAELRDKLERLRALMRSTVPDGDLATIIEEAVTEMLARLESRRSAATKRPRKSLAETKSRPSSRHVPAAVRRAVTVRDGGQCAFRDAEGRRCGGRERLEYHHRRPYGHGGDHSVDNVALLCSAHNRFLEEIDYGNRGAGG